MTIDASLKAIVLNTLSTQCVVLTYRNISVNKLIVIISETLLLSNKLQILSQQKD